MNQDTTTPPPVAPVSQAFHEQLLASGIDEQATAYIIGQFTQKALEMAVARSAVEIGEEAQKEIAAMPGDEKEKFEALQQAYETKTNESFNDLIAECFDLIVQEFEKLA